MKKNIILLMSTVLLLVVGYATITTTMNIDGVTTVGGNLDDFDIYFSTVVENGVENKKIIKNNKLISFLNSITTVGEKYVIDYEVTNGSKSYDADVKVSCTNSNEYLKITNEFDTTTNIQATATKSGRLTIELLKPFEKEDENINQEISCTITGMAVERLSQATGTPSEKYWDWKLFNDILGDNEVGVGDLITYGSESFYVYSVDDINGTLKAISQFNLYAVGGNNVHDSDGMQNEISIGYVDNISSPIGTLAFDSSINHSNVYENSTIRKEYVDNYGTMLNELGADIKEIRLITKEELNKLGCDNSTNLTCANSQYPWVYSTSYWTSSLDEENKVWTVTSNGSFNPTLASNNNTYGVRPVINLSTSLFSKK